MCSARSSNISGYIAKLEKKNPTNITQVICLIYFQIRLKVQSVFQHFCIIQTQMNFKESMIHVSQYYSGIAQLIDLNTLYFKLLA